MTYLCEMPCAKEAQYLIKLHGLHYVDDKKGAFVLPSLPFTSYISKVSIYYIQLVIQSVDGTTYSLLFLLCVYWYQ